MYLPHINSKGGARPFMGQELICTDLPASNPTSTRPLWLGEFRLLKRQRCDAGMSSPPAAHFIKSLEAALQEQQTLRSKTEALKDLLEQLDLTKLILGPLFILFPDV